MEQSSFKQCLILAITFSVFFCWGDAKANTWQELNTMTAVELNQKIEQLQIKIKKNGKTFNRLKELGIAYHIKAVDNKKAFAPKATEYLSQAGEMDKSDLEVLCYLGSATTMMAKTTINPIKKMSYVNKGTGYMDKAVNLAPDNITIRMTRALNSIKLPGFLNRESFAVNDFEYLAKRIEKDPNNLSFISIQVFQNLAELYQEKGDKEKAEFYQSKLTH